MRVVYAICSGLMTQLAVSLLLHRHDTRTFFLAIAIYLAVICALFSIHEAIKDTRR